MNQIEKYLRQTTIYKNYHHRKIEEAYFKKYDERRTLAESASIRTLIENVWYKNISYPLNLNSPTTFNEKLNWMKLNWFDERAFTCADKNLVRKYVTSMGLESILIKQIAVYDSAEAIDFENLPNRFVLKPSHDSGHTILCRDKSLLDKKNTICKLNKYLDVDYEFMSGEWVYSSQHKSIVCEEFMIDNLNHEILDYKFFCFNGNPEVIFFVSDRINHGKSDFYDLNWIKQDYRWCYEPSGKIFSRPYSLDKMIEYAKILSKGFPFVRVDFYEVDQKVYFGEMTFFHGGGLGWFKPEKKDYDFGEMIDIDSIAPADPWKIIHPKLSSEIMVKTTK